MDHDVAVTVRYASESGAAVIYPLYKGRTYGFLNTSGNHLVVCNFDSSRKPVGALSVESWGVKLKAIAEAICVMPQEPKQDEKYTLTPQPLSRTEIIFLRDGDSFSFKSHSTQFFIVIQVHVEDVQVRSSAAAAIVVDLQNDDPDSDQTEDEGGEVLPVDGVTPVSTLTKPELVAETPTSRILLASPPGNAASLPSTVHEVDPKVLQLHHIDALESGTEGSQKSYVTARVSTDNAEDVAGQLENELESTEGTLPVQGPQSTPSPQSDESILAGLEATAGDKETDEEVAKNPSRKQKGVAVVIPAISSKRSSPGDLENGDLDHTVGNRPSKRIRASLDESQDSRSEEIVVDMKTRRSKPVVLTRNLAQSSEEPSAATNLRSSQITVSESQLYEQPPPRIAFSNSVINEKGQTKNFLKRHGGSEVEEVTDANLLCVARTELKKKPKLLLAIVLGVPIVTEDWLINSIAAKRFLNTEGFRPRDPKNEKAWGFSLQEVNGKPQRHIFAGKSIYFTPLLSQRYESFVEGIKEIVHMAGAVAMEKLTSRISKGLENDGTTVVITLSDERDPDAIALTERGVKCYSRDILAASILRGNLDLQSDEFATDPEAAPKIPHNAPKSKKRGRPRKS